MATTPLAEAYRQFDAHAGTWASISSAQAGTRVVRWTDALARLGLPRGSRIAILLPDGIDAVCIDQAALALACVPVPLHAIDNPESIAYILGDSDAALLVAASDAQWRAIASVPLSHTFERTAGYPSSMDGFVPATRPPSKPAASASSVA